MHIIILGANSYVAQHVIEGLDYKKNKIIAVIREKSVENFKMFHPEIEVWCLKNINEYLKKMNNKIDVIINFICKYEKREILERDIWESNFYLPLNLFITLKEHGFKKYINIDTALPDNFNVYTKSKSMFSKTLKWYVEKDIYKSKYCICNILLENYYGKDELESRFLPSIIKKMKMNEDILLTVGTQKRDFIYIDDVVKAIHLIIEKEINSDYIDIPLGTGHAPTIKEVVMYLHKLTNSKSKTFFGAIQMREDEPDSVADLSVINKLGIEIEYNWKDGLKKII